tara:strand:- start:13734 stop:14192 length:459 start_codon:yes stop_codon:yes gene_type:complete
VKIKYSLLLFLLVFQTVFSQKNYVSDEEFNSKITWLEPHEVHLEFRDVLRKIPGANFEFKNYTNQLKISSSLGWLVDGILYDYPPQRLYASQVRYVEVVNSILQSNTCQCSLIIKTAVNEKELNSRKNILNRLNKNRIEKPKKKKKKKKKKD